MLAMASNPRYVEVEKSEEDPTCETHMLQTMEIQMDAERLLKEAKASWPEAFESKSDSKNLKMMADALTELNECGIKAFCTVEEA